MTTLYDLNSPPIKASSFTFYASVVSQGDANVFQTSVTLAAGDVKISKDGGAFANVGTLPTEIGTSGVLSCPLSSAEMTADVVVILFNDAAGSEWQDLLVEIRTETDQAALLVTDVWGASTRTLTSSAASTTATVSGSDITIVRGDSLSASLTSLGSLAGYTSLWFTAKTKFSDADTASIIQIRLNTGGANDGLLYFNGAVAVDESKGSITIDDGTDGDITIALDESLTDDLVDTGLLYYDVQVLISGDVTTLTNGTVKISEDITRVIT